MNWIFGYFGVACKSVYFIKIFMFLKLNFWILRIFGFWDFIDFLDFSLELLFQSRYHESCQNQGILDFFKILTISPFASNSRIFGFFLLKYFFQTRDPESCQNQGFLDFFCWKFYLFQPLQQIQGFLYFCLFHLIDFLLEILIHVRIKNFLIFSKF